MVYFAYGSNLNWEQMRSRCPSACFVSTARLENYRLAFTRRSQKRQCGVADVVHAPGCEVWGVLYEITGADMELLDRAEGFVPGGIANRYERVERAVTQVTGSRYQTVTAFVYEANRQANPPLPSIEYKRLIVEGAKHWKLPQAYLLGLEAITVG